MHYHAEIWVKDPEKVNEQIENIMSPYYKELEIKRHKEDGDVWFDNPNGFWDWWQIGGSYTGCHSGYNPAEDPANIEKCWLCNSTGFRNDRLGKDSRIQDPSYTCNGCGYFNHDTKQWEHGKYGPGKRLKWPTNFTEHYGDIQAVKDIDNDLTCFTLIADGKIFHQELWSGKTFEKTGFDGKVKQALSSLGIEDGFLVTVDYHS